MDEKNEFDRNVSFSLFLMENDLKVVLEKQIGDDFFSRDTCKPLYLIDFNGNMIIR
jgi:hypothetical protein